MSNLKKVIALSLAATSVFSTVASATAFTDAESISKDEAVETLVALNIIAGIQNSDGSYSFNPTASVDRASMAKMLYVIHKKGVDDGGADWKNFSTDLVDIEGHWAEGYIKWAENQGIISGAGNGYFYPNLEVDVPSALKMCLVTLGYDADAVGLVGDGWDKNTLYYATQSDLTDDIGAVAGSASREAAAQIIYNTLFSDIVRYNVLANDYIAVDGYTYAESAMNLVIHEGTVTGITEGKIVTTAGTFEAGEDFYHLMGHDVEVLTNDSKSLTYGVKVSADTDSIVTIKDNVKTDKDNTAGTYSVAYNGLTINISSDNYDLIEAATKNATLIIALNDGETLGNVTTVEPNIATVTYTNDSKVNVSMITSAGSQSYTFEDDTIPSNIAEDDVVVVSYSPFTDSCTLTVLTAQTGTITAVTAKDGASTHVYEIGGESYTIPFTSTVYSLKDEIEFYAVGSLIYSADKSSSSTADVSDYITISTINDNIYVGSSASTDSVEPYLAAVVTFSTGATLSVKLGYKDTNGKLGSEVADLASMLKTENIITGEVTSEGSGAKGNLGGLFTYSVKDGYYILEAVIDEGSFDDYATGTVSFEADGDKTKIDGNLVSDNAVFYVFSEDQDELTVLSGAQVKAWGKTISDMNYTVISQEIDSFNTVVVGYLDLASAKVPGSSSDINFGYVTSDTRNVIIGDDEFTEIKIFDGSTTSTYYYDADADARVISKGYVISYIVESGSEIEVLEFENSDTSVYDVITDENYTYAMGQVSGYSSSSGYISFAKNINQGTGEEDAEDCGSFDYTETYEITDETQIIFINSEDTAGDFSSIGLAKDTEGDTYKNSNVFVVANDELEVVAIYVDVNYDIELKGIVNAG